jgi:hypothetical protein
MADKYVSAKFKVWATVYEDDGSLVAEISDIVSASASFALNTIPTASLILATGYNPITGKAASIHDLKSKLKPRQKVEVRLKITTGGGDSTKVQEGTFKIFDGFLAGIGYQRSINQANYVINLVHWLDDLNNSSAINGNWFPGAPMDYAQAAVQEREAQTPTTGPTPGFAGSFFSIANISTDLWQQAIKPLFEKIAGFASTVQQPGVAPAGGKELEINTAAKKALARMPGTGAAYYKPLQFYVSAAGSNTGMTISLSEYFTKTISDSYAQNSFWSKLITEYAAQFLFAVSPAVDWALPIPFCAGLRWKDGGKTITAAEYSYGNFNANMSQILESVVICYPLDSKVGSVRVDLPANAPKPLGYYRAFATYPTSTTPETTRGLKLFKAPPAWFANLGAAAVSASQAVVGSRTAAAPAAGTKAGTGPDVPAPAGEAYDLNKSTLDAFAQHWFVSEVLQQRYGELSGPLRFDIAPGSIVKIVLPKRDENREKAAENPEEFVIASVMSASYVINAERSTAGTSFAIAHTKTETESTSTVYSVEKPPLYVKGDPWHDGPLAIPE